MSRHTPPDSSTGPDDVDRTAAARGGVYALLARAFRDPDEAFYDALTDGTLDATLRSLLDDSGLDVAAPTLATTDDYDTLCARYNDLFVVGFSEVVDPMDGTMSSQGPAVPLYESDYRPNVSWNDVNLDLARAYEFFGVNVDQTDRDNHDHLRLELEFVGYLCRQAAVGHADIHRARLDFLDRHLRVLAPGVEKRLESEPGTDIYGEFASFLDRFSRADVDDLAERFDGGETE
jgi:DMSO reductase family type II enzyme chaperone